VKVKPEVDLTRPSPAGAAESGQSSSAALLAGADRILALTPPGFDTEGEPPPNTRSVGPIGPPDPLQRWV
jgi:hypothetical protein